MQKQCPQCLKSHDNDKFCSKSCAATYNNLRHPKRKPEHKCAKCGGPCTSRRTFCLPCRKEIDKLAAKLKSSTLEEHLNGHKTSKGLPANRYSGIRGLARRWNRERLSKGCQVCGYSKHVEVAHIIAISKCPVPMTLGEINGPKNTHILCPNHHWEFDHDLLTLPSPGRY